MLNSFLEVRQQPEPQECEYSIFEAKIQVKRIDWLYSKTKTMLQELGEKDFGVWQQQQRLLQAKRAGSPQQQQQPGQSGPASKKRREDRVEVLTLESSEDEEVCFIPYSWVELSGWVGMSSIHFLVGHSHSLSQQQLKCKNNLI